MSSPLPTCPMSSRASENVERARSLIGTRFRSQGRGADGVDCVGVAAFALSLPTGSVPRDYSLRGTSRDALRAMLRRAGLIEVSDRAPGDIAVHAPGPMQLHLGVVTHDGLVHADIALGRVVERPWPPPWPLVGLWRPVPAH